MPKPSTTTMRRRRLGAELEELRENAGVSRKQAADVLDCADSRIGHIENGRNVIRKLELNALVQLYGMDTEKHEFLEELRQQATKRRGWSSTYRLPTWLRTYVDMETDATTVRSFDVEVIPGLLQTEEYARRLHLVAGDLFSPDEVERLVAARKRRQLRLFDDEAPLNFSTVVSEAAFRRTMGDTEIGPAQLAHVLELAQRPNVTVQVMPYTAGLHPSMSGAFSVLTFGDVAPPFGHQENATGHITDDQKVIRRLVELWEMLRSQALTPEESWQWISEVARQA
ncbi:MAG: helix-turn-helix domain-containing protein [Pseudonocardiales bacterium]